MRNLLIALLLCAVIVLAAVVREHSNNLHKLNCTHYIYEDGSVVHEDAEVAENCISN